jgi:hypothetical protein
MPASNPWSRQRCDEWSRGAPLRACSASSFRSSAARPGTTAWSDPRLAALAEVLAEEFELEDRTEELLRRLAYTTDALRWAIEAARSHRGVVLEKVIIYLIAAELGMSVLHALLR